MSDTTVAQPNAAPAPAPSNEVPINQNPVSTPNPLGPQTPSVPVRDRAETARDAVQRAFDRANNPQPKSDKPAPRPAPKAAEAKVGHNQPPEETPRLNLKKRPDDQPQDKGDRNERGQFAPRQVKQPDGPVNQQQNVAREQTAYKKLPPHAPYAEPPVRMAEHGKRDWVNTPESVRGEVHRVQAEFAKAYQYYKDDHEAFKPLKQFHQMAQEHGTTLEKALGNYISMEQKLRADPLGGLDLIVHNLGLVDPETNRPITLRDVAYTVLSQSPEQLRMMQQGNQQNAAQHQIGALHQKIERLENEQRQMHAQQQFTYTRSAVDQFATSHPRFDELGTAIEQELKLGFNLDQAYARADRLYPATHAAQTRNPPAQTRPTDRSISGAPDVAPSNGASRKQQKASPTARDAVLNAMLRYGGTH